MKNKHYTYYMYYKDDYLYAYTDNKNISQLFERDRNMSLFKKRKIKLSRKEVNQLASDYQCNILDKHELKTFKSNGSRLTFNIVMTMLENLTVTNTLNNFIYNDLTKLCWTPPTLFNNEYEKYLDEIGYTFIYYIIKGKIPGFDAFSLKVDELKIFLELYSDTLK